MARPRKRRPLVSCAYHRRKPLLSANCVLVLPINEDQLTPDIPPKEVTKIALRLKHQIEQVVPCELEEDSVTTPLSPIITSEVVQTAKEAGGEEYRACVVFCLLICHKWFERLATLELWDADLHHIRAVACEIIAKRM